MSCLTLEVEIDHGKVTAKVPSKLPDKACGLLTIFQPDHPAPLQAIEAPQALLQLDAVQADGWLEAVRNARR